MPSIRLLAAATGILLLLGPCEAAAQQPVGSPPTTPQPSGTLIAAVLRGGDPVARAPIRLRDVASGRIRFRGVSSERGEFTFRGIPAGSYVSELLDEDNDVLAYGEVFSILPEQTVVTVIDASKKRRPPRRSSDTESTSRGRSRRLGGKFWLAAAAVASGAVVVGTMSSGR